MCITFLIDAIIIYYPVSCSDIPSDYENVPKEYTCLDITLPRKDRRNKNKMVQQSCSQARSEQNTQKIVFKYKILLKCIQIQNTKYSQ